MQKYSRLLISFISLMISFFSLFGFLATFEPVSNAIAFRAFYSILGITTITISIRMMYLAIRNPSLVE